MILLPKYKVGFADVTLGILAGRLSRSTSFDWRLHGKMSICRAGQACVRIALIYLVFIFCIAKALPKVLPQKKELEGRYIISVWPLQQGACAATWCGSGEAGNDIVTNSIRHLLRSLTFLWSRSRGQVSRQVEQLLKSIMLASPSCPFPKVNITTAPIEMAGADVQTALSCRITHARPRQRFVTATSGTAMTCAVGRLVCGGLQIT
jgi:hypothetical protein